MPRIIALLPGAVASVDLGHFACRLDLGVTQVGTVPALALVYRFPPSPPALFINNALVSLASFAQITLVRSVMEFAEDTQSVQRVADVGLAGGTREADAARITEAFKMFHNMPRARREAVEEATKEGLEVLNAYWFVRDWLSGGATENTQSDFLGTRLLCQA